MPKGKGRPKGGKKEDVALTVTELQNLASRLNVTVERLKEMSVSGVSPKHTSADPPTDCPEVELTADCAVAPQAESTQSDPKKRLSWADQTELEDLEAPLQPVEVAKPIEGEIAQATENPKSNDTPAAKAKENPKPWASIVRGNRTVGNVFNL